MKAGGAGLVVLALAVAAVGAVKVMKEPRGIRNNNPGNIRHVAGQTWRGQVGNDGAFVIFDTPQNGIRALARLLGNYYSRHGLNTVAEIINRWAPPIENKTSAYVAAVSRAVGQPPQLPMSEDRWREVLPMMVDAIIKHENGTQPYSLAQISSGIAAA